MLNNKLIDKYNELVLNLLGSNFNETLTNQQNYDNLTDGYIYDKIQDGTINDEVLYTGQTESLESFLTYSDYINNIKSIKTVIDYYLSDTSNNNGDLQTLGTSGTDNGKPIGRNGYYYRYTMAYIQKLGFYKFKRIKLQNNGVVYYDDLFSDDYFNINDYVNLETYYETNILNDFLDISYIDIFNNCGYYIYSLTPPDIIVISQSTNFSYLDTTKSKITYTNESTELSSLVGNLESELLLFSNPQLSSIFSKINIVKLTNPKAIEMRIIDNVTYLDIKRFYDERGLNNLIELFNIDTITPNDVVDE